MARNKSSKKSSKKKSSKRNHEHDERNKRIMLGGAILIGAAGVFVGTAMGVGELDRKAADFLVPEHPSVIINWPTDGRDRVWMPESDQREIEKTLANAVKGGSALSRSPLEEAGLAMMRTGWLDAVPTVRWTSDGDISIEANWRVPIAAVRLGDREYIIDGDRHMLPLDYPVGQSNQHYFVGIDARLPEIGEQWLGTDLEDGIALLKMLGQEQLLEQVAGIDLGDGNESGTLRIITIRDATIVWGAGPGRERPGEVPTGSKIGRLQEFLKTSSLIDGGFGFIDIRGADILVVRSEN